VAGTKCDINNPKSINLLPTHTACEDNTSGNNGKKISPGITVFIVFMVAFVVFGGIGAALYVYHKRGGRISFLPNVGRKVKTTVHYEEESTALDDDLLEAKEADELDDNVIKETLGSKTSDESNFDPRSQTLISL